MKAILALENGIWYEGDAAGAAGETGGEVVFNTSMTGYQEVLTDPSYAGQIVTMTCPEIGNYGVTPEDGESRGRRSPASSSATSRRSRATGAPARTLRDYLVRNNVVAISDIDTRALTRVLRSAGVMRGVIATGDADPRELVETGAGHAADGRIRSRPRRHVRAPFDWSPRAVRRVHAAARAPAEAAAARRRVRLRHEVEHPAPLHGVRLRRARVSGDRARVRAARDRIPTACS